MSSPNFKIAFLLLVGELISGNLRRGVPSLKNALRKTFFRNGWYSDDHDGLEEIYQGLKDPWNFESSQYEQERLQLLLRKAVAHTHDSVLEVGCAEGVFTSMLARIARRVVAIDVSPTAIARARIRCPMPTYATVSLQDFETDEKFDLVMCAETLYYIKDVAQALRKLSSLGRHCVVSYLEREAKRLNPYLVQIPSVEMKRHVLGKGPLRRAVIVASWENEAPGSAVSFDAASAHIGLTKTEVNKQ